MEPKATEGEARHCPEGAETFGEGRQHVITFSWNIMNYSKVIYATLRVEYWLEVHT